MRGSATTFDLLDARTPGYRLTFGVCPLPEGVPRERLAVSDVSQRPISRLAARMSRAASPIGYWLVINRSPVDVERTARTCGGAD